MDEIKQFEFTLGMNIEKQGLNDNHQDSLQFDANGQDWNSNKASKSGMNQGLDNVNNSNSNTNTNTNKNEEEDISPYSKALEQANNQWERYGVGNLAYLSDIEQESAKSKNTHPQSGESGGDSNDNESENESGNQEDDDMIGAVMNDESVTQGRNNFKGWDKDSNDRESGGDGDCDHDESMG